MAMTKSRHRMISGAPASVLDFGALGDGSTDDTAAFLATIASGADEIRVPRGTYILTGTLTLPDGVRLVGEGQGWEFSHPTSLLFQGTGTASRTIAGCGTHSVANPAAGTAYLADSGTRGDSYKLLDLTVAFSVGIILSKGSGLANLGIFPNFSGVSGYAGTDGALSDDWDVGVWSRNADHCTIDRCVVAGHWRLAALLHTASDIDDGRTPANERGRYTHNHFQGFRGIAIRTGRRHQLGAGIDPFRGVLRPRPVAPVGPPSDVERARHAVRLAVRMLGDFRRHDARRQVPQLHVPR
jgi:hypothetical protein